MTSLERIRAVLRGDIPDRLPVLPQGFMFAMYDSGYSIGQVNRNPALMAKLHVACREKYGYDGCVMDVDDSTLAEACGAKVLWRDNDVATVDENSPRLKSLREIDDLALPDPMKDGRLPEWLETTKRISEEIGEEAVVIGRADQGPFSLLTLLRGTQNFIMDLLQEDEEVIFHALEWTTKAHILFAKAQLEAGAHVTSMGDAYASPNLISPDMYIKYALPYEKQVVEAVQGAEKPYSIHICGDSTRIIEQMGKTGAKILEVDWKLDLKEASRLLPDDTVLMGNINPSFPLYLGTPEDVENAVKEVITSTGGRNIIVSSGCAVGANTPPENISALVNATKEFGSYERLMELRKI